LCTSLFFSFCEIPFSFQTAAPQKCAMQNLGLYFEENVFFKILFSLYIPVVNVTFEGASDGARMKLL
jgi:hypothetical protein